MKSDRFQHPFKVNTMLGSLFHRRLSAALPLLVLLSSLVLRAQDWTQIYPSHDINHITRAARLGGDSIALAGLNETLLISPDGGVQWETVMRKPGSLDICGIGYTRSHIIMLPGGRLYYQDLVQDTSQAYLLVRHLGESAARRVYFPTFGQRLLLGTLFHLDMSVTPDAVFLLQSCISEKRITLLRSADLGLSWSRLPLPDTLSALLRPTLVFRDSLRGIVLAHEGSGSRDYVAHVTRDGGQSWSRMQTIRYASSKYGGLLGSVPIRWLDDTTIAAGLEDGSCMISRDAGRTWLRAGGIPAVMRTLVMHATGIGYASGPLMDVYRTTDFGRGWTLIHPGSGDAAASSACAAGDSSYVLATLAGDLLSTTDAGLTWSFAPASEAGTLRSAQPYDSTRGVLRGAEVLLTEDGGSTWHSASPVPLQPVGTLVASDPLEAWVFRRSRPGTDTLLFETRDGGTSWRPLLLDTCAGARQSGAEIAFMRCGADTMFIAYMSGLYRSIDGGRSWIFLPALGDIIAQYGSARAIAAPCGSRIWLLLNSIGSGYLFSSDDGGAGWDSVLTRPPDMIMFTGMSVLGCGHVVVYGFDANMAPRIATTPDAGRTWTFTAGAGLQYQTAVTDGVLLFPTGQGFGTAVVQSPVNGGLTLTLLETRNFWQTVSTRYTINVPSATYASAKLSSDDRRVVWIQTAQRVFLSRLEGLSEAGSVPLPNYVFLGSGYPQPARSSVALPYRIGSTGPVRFDLYDAMGRLIRVLPAPERTPGEHLLTMDTAALRAGVYFVRMTTQQGGAVMKFCVHH